jgi:hypothetical protein
VAVKNRESSVPPEVSIQFLETRPDQAGSSHRAPSFRIRCRAVHETENVETDEEVRLIEREPGKGLLVRRDSPAGSGTRVDESKEEPEK